MDFALHYPGDIDAVDILKGKLVIYEFKRKNCAGSFYQTDPKVYATTFGKLIKEFKGEIDKAKATKRADIEAVVKKISGARLFSTSCFGLDYYSHVKNVITAEFSNIIYRHVIWEQQSCAIDKLLNQDLEPKFTPKFIYADIKINDFIGFNFTDPNDSGDVHHKHAKIPPIRYQLMIDRKKFKFVA
jgi:hypothetical protein